MISRLALPILFLIVLPCSLQSQEEVRPFAYAFHQQGRFAEGGAAVHKMKVARQVFDRLVEARGDAQDSPRFVMENGERYVAWCDPDRHEVGLEELAYDVCKSMGPDSLDALAFLLAHELIHYYDRHDWNRAFVRSHTALELSRELAGQERQDTLLEHLRYETQADHLGGFLAQRAGFKPYRRAGELLDKVYAAYGLPEELPGYPTRRERIAIADSSRSSLDSLLLLHDLATMLTLASEYDGATACYEVILKRFPSREIYGNAGLIQLLAAMDRYTAQEFPYALPAQWDPRPRTNTRSADQQRIKERQEHLEQALRHLRKSVKLDERYATGWLNLACALVLEQAEGCAATARQAMDKARMAGAAEAGLQALEGILLDQSGDRRGAVAIWKKSAAANCSAADLNLALSGESAKKDSPSAVVPASQTPMDGLTLDEYLSEEFARADRSLTLPGKKATGQILEYAGSRILGFQLELPNGVATYVFAQECLSCPDRTESGIGIGSPHSALHQAHGSPDRIMGTPEGDILMYGLGDERTWFRLNGEQIDGWGKMRRVR